jgi:hypothetical protein
VMSIHVQHCSFVDSSILSHLCSATIHVASFSASSRAIWSSISEWHGNNRMVDYSIRVCVFYCLLSLSPSLCGSAIWCTVTSSSLLMLGEYLYWLVPTACLLSSPCVLVPPPMLLVNTWSLVQQRPSSSCSFDINICWLVHQSTSHDSFIQAVGSSRHYFMTAADWLWCQYMFSIVALWTAAFYLICVVQQYMWLRSVLAVEQSDDR